MNPLDSIPGTIAAGVALTIVLTLLINAIAPSAWPLVG